MVQNSETEKDKNKEIVYKLLEEVFESSIVEADLTDSVVNLTELYNSFSTQGFESSFEDILMIILNESRRSSDVQKLFKFISEFIVALDNKYKAEHSKKKKGKNAKDDHAADDEEDLVHPFLQHLFAILESWSKAASYVIRFRACQLLYMVLTNILDNGVGEIDVHTYEKIASLIQSRRKDISANVRAHSVMLAKFFQDPTDHNDPVIAGLLWQLEADPNARVRQNIVEIIAACEETIIPITRRFLYDKNALVRNAALLHICHRISPRSYTTHQRIRILNQCFYDSCASIRRNAEQKLIPMWFRAYGDKLCLFFKNLRLGNDCLDKLPFTRDLLLLLFKLVKISQILEEIDLDPETVLPKSLNGEIIFIWRHFYSMAYRQEKLRKYIPEPENLIEFIIKCFKESAFDGNVACIYNELISFAMDVIDVIGEEKCEKLPPVAIDIMKNPFIPREVIPYAVGFYCEYATKETKEIHNDLLEVVNELLKFVDISTGEEQKKFILRCLDIFSETLAQDNISGNVELIAVKDELVLSHFDSDDEDVKLEALKALSLYCLIDFEEAKQFWPLIQKALDETSNTESKQKVAKGAFDILNCYGSKLFGDHDEAFKQFEETLDKLITHLQEHEVDVSLILKGMFKLYLSHHTYNPSLLARLIILMFEDETMYIAKTSIINFHQSYGESKEEAECLTRAFLVVINMLFDSHKNSPYHKISIKTVATELLELAKMYEENKNFEVEDRFRDLLAVKLTRKFLKKPWRLSAIELQDVAEHIIPKDIEKLHKLKANVKLIIESLQSAIFQQKNPFSKKSIKFFTNYMKKIQTAIDVGSDDEHGNYQHNRHSSGNSFLARVPLEQVSPDVFVQNGEVSF